MYVIRRQAKLNRKGMTKRQQPQLFKIEHIFQNALSSLSPYEICYDLYKLKPQSRSKLNVLDLPLLRCHVAGKLVFTLGAKNKTFGVLCS